MLSTAITLREGDSAMLLRFVLQFVCDYVLICFLFSGKEKIVELVPWLSNSGVR